MDYKSNSNLSKTESSLQPKAVEPTLGSIKKVGKLVSGRTVKQSESKKLTKLFISDEVANVKSYVIMDVLIPAIKKAISDIITNGIDMILYGETGHTSKKSTASKISYRNYYDEPKRREASAPTRRNDRDYDDIVLDNRGEAEAVLARMDEVIDTYGMVSIADLYEMVDVTGTYTDNKYGWIDIQSATTVRVKDGYMLKLPRAVPLH